jgi:hypothetical protein
MELKFKVTPSKVVANTKYSVLSRANLSGWSFDGCGSHYYGRDEKYVKAINLTKVRRKTKQKQFINKEGVNTTKSQVINKSHWVGYVYTFDTALLKAMRLEIQQGSRNFKIVKK